MNARVGVIGQVGQVAYLRPSRLPRQPAWLESYRYLDAAKGRMVAPAVSVQVGSGGIQGSPSKSWVRASIAETPFLRVVDR